MDNNFKLDLTLLSKELKLLLELLKEDNEEGIQKNKQELFSDINWEHFLYLARHHRVYPLMYVRLKNMGGGLVPKEVIENLYQEYKRNTFQMLKLSSEMERVSKLFTENGIQLLFLKGPVIAKNLYGDISKRTSKDLDILIREKDFERAEKLLFHLGYEREEVITVFNERAKRYHHIAYTHSESQVQIEIHWRLHSPPTKEPLFDELWRRKRISSLTSYPVFFLGEKDLFFFLVLHGARHGWFRLRWLKDFDRIIREGGYINQVNLIVTNHDYRFFLGQAFILSSQLLNTPINEEVKLITSKSKSRKLAGKSYLYIRNPECDSCDKLYLFSLRSQLQKLQFIAILLYPCAQDLETLRLPKFLHFLYFPLRPFLWTWRKTKQLISS